MLEKNLNNLNKSEISNFFESWVKKRSKFELIRPYKLDKMVYQTMKIIKFYLKDKKDLPIIKIVFLFIFKTNLKLIIRNLKCLLYLEKFNIRGLIYFIFVSS